MRRTSFRPYSEAASGTPWSMRPACAVGTSPPRSMRPKTRPNRQVLLDTLLARSPSASSGASRNALSEGASNTPEQPYKSPSLPSRQHEWRPEMTARCSPLTRKISVSLSAPCTTRACSKATRPRRRSAMTGILRMTGIMGSVSSTLPRTICSAMIDSKVLNCKDSVRMKVTSENTWVSNNSGTDPVCFKSFAMCTSRRVSKLWVRRAAKSTVVAGSEERRARPSKKEKSARSPPKTLMLSWANFLAQSPGRAMSCHVNLPCSTP
mmetsp:Transcript_124993/g.361550  ORF Transcript_124993/g.361550 Transcript_124993/m.361550 type:complete len:265 (-) Transcript_124993:562-1356(-)